MSALDKIAGFGWDVFLAGLGLAGVAVGVMIGVAAVTALIGFFVKGLTGKDKR